MAKKCKYTRDSEIEQYTPACCMDDDYSDTCVHEEDISEWTYCPFCSHKIQAYTAGQKENHR